MLLTSVTAGCNDDDDSSSYYYDNTEYTNCAISSFSLAKDDSILRSLDSVYFSIDLVNATVFNADSLPKGTDISRLIVNISAPAAGKIELTFKSRYSESDTTVNFTENPTDSINFANGPVTMTVTAYNGQATRNYTVNVLVHNMVADTLYWDTLERTSLPKAATAQKTAKLGDKLYTLLEGTDGQWYVSSTENPADAASARTSVATMPSDADINSFSATDNSLYITDKSGKLYSSTDGISWTSTDGVMNCVYGGYGSTLLGARQDSDGWKHVTWPATTESAIASDCPVSGTSQMVIYSSKWSNSDLAIMIGGKDSQGRYSGETWAYDGTRWDRISTTGIDEREGVTLFSYTIPQTSTTSWSVTENQALLAMGGRYETENGMTADNKVYVSYDYGITWKEADSWLQFPESYPGFSSAQAYVIETTLHSRSVATEGWQKLTTRGIPTYAIALTGGRSRISSPVTSWECPYIYMYGGMDSDSKLIPYVTRGVINRLTFKPIY